MSERVKTNNLAELHDLNDRRSRLTADPTLKNNKDNKERAKLTIEIHSIQQKIHAGTPYQAEAVISI